MDKTVLRRENFSRIKSLSPEEKAEHSECICRHIERMPEYQAARCVFAYLALPGEPDLGSLVLSAEKDWAFSRVDTVGQLRFHKVTSLGDLRLGAFGFLEPDPKASVEVSPDEAGLILVPGVGFDPENGARLGRGKGHYDQFLAPALELNPDLLIVGVCFSVQLIRLVPEPHDVPMQRILTERGWE